MRSVGLGALVAVLVLGVGVEMAAAQTRSDLTEPIPGLALQRALTRNRIRRGGSADIFRRPQQNIPLDLLVPPHLQSFIYPSLPQRDADSPISLDSPTPAQIRSGEAFQ